MLAVGYHQPTARSARVWVARSGPLTLSRWVDRAPALPAAMGRLGEKTKCEKAPCTRNSDRIGLAAPVIASGRPANVLAASREPKLCPITLTRGWLPSDLVRAAMYGPSPFSP